MCMCVYIYIYTYTQAVLIFMVKLVVANLLHLVCLYIHVMKQLKSNNVHLMDK